MTSPDPKSGGEAQVDAKQLLKLAIDLLPLLIFFGTYKTLGIQWATGVLMVTSIISMAVSWYFLGHIPTMLLVSTLLVIGFGAMTLYLNDPRFIKMKPTIVYLLFAAALFGGLLAGKPMLQSLLGEALRLTHEGWVKLSVRWGMFFVAMAGLNEIIWRMFSETTWATFKVFGFLPLTVIFFASQYGLIERYRIVPDATDKSAG